MISEECSKIFKELQSDVKDALEKSSKSLAKESVQKLKGASPKRTGKYSSGWGQSKNKDVIVIYNKKKPGLTHLLEKGHAKRNGGRVAPIKHIEPIEQWVIKESEERFEKEFK